MTSLFLGHESKGGELSGWKTYLMRAWAVSTKFLGRSFDVFIDRDCEVKRKERSDVGFDIFCHESKRKQTFTALNTFKKLE